MVSNNFSVAPKKGSREENDRIVGHEDLPV